MLETAVLKIKKINILNLTHGFMLKSCYIGESGLEYYSCSNIQNGIRFEYNNIKLCCLVGDSNLGPLYIKKDFYGEKLNWQELMQSITKIREDQKKGHTNPHCNGCIGIQKQNWDNNTRFKWIQIAHWADCNCNCRYCYRVQDDFELPKSRYKIMPIIKELDKMQLIDYDGELSYSGGEPASLREFDEITNFFIKKGEKLIMVHTNGIKPVKSVINGLKTDTMSVTVSVDCGSREKFKQIKQVDAYDKVKDTLKKYVKAQGTNKRMVRSKYIIVPGVNDTKQDIDLWVDETLKIGIQEVLIDFESTWLDHNIDNIPSHIDDIFMYLEDSIKSKGLHLGYYAVANKYRTLKNKDNPESLNIVMHGDERNYTSLK